MAAPLISTKIHIPPLRAGSLQRSRLVEHLNQGLECKLTLVSAPAGYGKTTLLNCWIRSIAEPAAWLSLDKRDGDLASFLSYLVATLQTIDPAIGLAIPDMLQLPRPEPTNAVLTTLINDIASFSREFVLVLDDYHEIEAPAVHEAMRFLLDYLPSNLHVAIATRADPPLQLAHLRGLGQLTELRATELCFTPQESAEFLNHLMGLALSAEEIGTLTTYTEGWITGLLIAALSMQDSQDTSQFIHTFSGSHRHILDYLLEVVLERQPENVRDFLLQTSILDHLSGPVCDAVTCQDASQRMLERLEKSNLFIISLDNERHWYRYHRLFADLLRQHLQKTMPELFPELHLRAGRWFEYNGMPDVAIHHTLSAGDFGQAAHLIEGAAQKTLMRSEVMTFLSWVEALPDETVRVRPSLCIYHAWALLLAGQPPDMALARLQDAEAGAAAGMITAEAYAFRALIALLVGDVQRSLELSQQALELIPLENYYWRSVLVNNLGMATVMSGDLEKAIETFEEGAQLGQETGNVMFAVGALSNLAGLYRVKGQLKHAEELACQALEQATDAQGQRLPVAGRALLILGDLAREHNNLEAAANYLRESLELFRQYGEIATLVSYLNLARVLQAQGDQISADELLQTAQYIAHKSVSTQLDDLLVSITRARMWVERGDLEAANHWLEQRQVERTSASAVPKDAGSRAPALYDLQEAERVLLAQVYLSQNHYKEAEEELKLLQRRAEDHGRMMRMVEILNLRALVLQAQGEIQAALEALKQSLQLAEPQGYMRVFIDLGRPMARLLYEAASKGLAPAYTGRLLAAFPSASNDPAGSQQVKPQGELVEPLSQRELEVLRLIADGLTNRELAERLVISLSTVKGHTANIYSKLGVKNRTQAVARARELGIIS
jgi:LuxR family maltose regulon positive regulatory protein